LESKKPKKKQNQTKQLQLENCVNHNNENIWIDSLFTFYFLQFTSTEINNTKSITQKMPP